MEDFFYFLTLALVLNNFLNFAWDFLLELVHTKIYHSKMIKTLKPKLKILKFKNVLNESGFILINALNEILVQKFLENKITFSNITNKLLEILSTNIVKNYLKNHQIRHINDVFKVYNFSRSIVN